LISVSLAPGSYFFSAALTDALDARIDAIAVAQKSRLDG
jgi:hypothetical protein